MLHYLVRTTPFNYQLERAIAEFQKQRRINQPEREKSLAQQRREKIAEVKRQQAEIRRARKEAAEELAKQQNPDLEQRRLETLRQIEEFNQRQQTQNPEDTTKINSENLEDE